MGMKQVQKLGLAPLSEKTVKILELIARGYSYEQITDIKPNITYTDIRESAEEVLKLHARLKDLSGQKEQPVRRTPDYKLEQRYPKTSTSQDFVDEVLKYFPRAYEAWTPEDDSLLDNLWQQNISFTEMSSQLKRPEKEIRSRINFLRFRNK